MRERKRVLSRLEEMKEPMVSSIESKYLSTERVKKKREERHEQEGRDAEKGVKTERETSVRKDDRCNKMDDEMRRQLVQLMLSQVMRGDEMRRVK